MTITLIHGQNHKGCTYNIGRLLAEQFAGAEINEFFLPKDLEHFCTGCYSCIEKEEACPFFAEKSKIMQAVENSELLIFTTPTYCMRASAPMKSFIDLTFTYWMSHRPRACMFSKKAIVISTAAGTGTKSAIRDISNALFYWGVPYIKEYGISVQAMSWEKVSDKKKAKIKSDIAKLACRIKNDRIHIGAKTKFMFGVMRMMQKNNMGSGEQEREYWQEKGWLGRKRPWK